LDGSVANIGDKTPHEVSTGPTQRYYLTGYTDGAPVVKYTTALSMLYPDFDIYSLTSDEYETWLDNCPYYECAVIKEDGTVATNGGYWTLNGDQHKFYSVEISYGLSGDEDAYETSLEAAFAADAHALEIGCSTGTFHDNIYQIITPAYECSVCGASK
jgi:hypothetical protein